MCAMPAKHPVEVFIDHLRDHGLRMTPQRKLILEVFLESASRADDEHGPGHDPEAAQGRHLAPEELYAKVKEQDPSVGQATVYRTLKLLAEAGLAAAQQFGDGRARYEPAYGISHHDHLICQQCRRTVEIVDPRIEALQEELARSHGFELTSHQMDLFGICPQCRTKAAQGPKT